MQEYRKNLGKVSLTAEGAWTKDKSFDILSIVYDEHTLHGFISKQAVPKGVDLYNKEYWMPFNVSGYSDNNIIILSEKTSETAIKAYTLEEAINSVAAVGRRPGMILGFYNENTDRLDIGGRWEIWQFNSTTISEWEDIAHWQNIYYSFNKFVGWYRDVESLKKYNPFPEIGCYAYVGTEFNEATIYRCDTKFIWTDTTQHAWDYIKVILQGNVTVGENGNWFNDGKDTGIPASIKGENGKTPVFRQYDNTIQYSFDNVNWITISDKVAAWFRWNATTGDTQANNVGRIQISRDNVTWTNLSGDIINKLHISRYIGADESLPTSGIAEGTIYAKGPYYAEDDALNDNPIYRLWVYAWKGDTLAWQDNGEFTSIAAGVVQETGDSETEVMSQKAVSEKLTELASETGNIASQIGSVKAIVDNVSSKTSFGNVLGYSPSGDAVSYLNWNTTDFIECKENDVITFKLYACGTTMCMLSFFDSNKNFISGITHGEGANAYYLEGTQSVPSNAKYFKGLWLMSSSETPYISINTNLKERIIKVESEVKSIIDNFSKEYTPTASLESHEQYVTDSYKSGIWYTMQGVDSNIYILSFDYYNSYKKTSINYGFVNIETKEIVELGSFDCPNSQISTVYVNIVKPKGWALYVQGNISYSSIEGVTSYNILNGELQIRPDIEIGLSIRYISTQAESELRGKKMTIIGDSWVEGEGVPNNLTWHGLITDKNGMIGVNLGLGGCCLSYNNAYNSTDGNFNKEKSVVNRLNNIPSDSDYILMLAGTNDILTSDVIIGNIDDEDITTICGAMNKICSDLQTNYPSSKIGIIMPFYVNNPLLTSKQRYIDVVNALINIAEKYSIPVFNSMINGGINFYNTSLSKMYTLGDKTHLNELGHSYISNRLGYFVKSL